MSGRERRILPGKECVVSLRFRAIAHGHADDLAASDKLRVSKDLVRAATLEDEALPISECADYFTSHEKRHVGEPLEMYFTLPRDLTSRSPELSTAVREWFTWMRRPTGEGLEGLAQPGNGSPLSRWRATGRFRFGWLRRITCCRLRAAER